MANVDFHTARSFDVHGSSKVSIVLTAQLLNSLMQAAGKRDEYGKSRAMTSTQEGSVEEVQMLEEKLTQIELMQEELIVGAKQEARRDAIRENETERTIHAESRAAQDNPGNAGHRSTHQASHALRFVQNIIHDLYVTGQRATPNVVGVHSHSSIPPWDGSVTAGGLELKW